MIEQTPTAFFSYVRAVDDHEDGKLSEFRKRLEGEVRTQTGDVFSIFQDRNDIAWGQKWKERIKESISNSTFLIPIITPGFFKSPACREEFEAFEQREILLGSRDLILPVYYITSDAIERYSELPEDRIAKAIRERNWTDWRAFRFRDLRDSDVSLALADLAQQIKQRIDNLSAVRMAEAKAQATSSRVAPSTLSSIEVISAQDKITLNVPEVSPKAAKKKIELPAGIYRAYTKRFDEIMHASKMVTSTDIAKLQPEQASYIDKLSSNFSERIKELRKTISAKARSQSTLVTLLLDNSGSLRGQPIKDVAAWSLLAAETLEQCGIVTEVLGYTTKMWKGGQSRELWIKEGKPANPGRLNDLRHVIYKTSDDNIRQSAASFTLMVRDGFLKENVDGEALLWAVHRQDEIDASRKILIVCSDGAPVDDSTLSTNDTDTLEKHLKSVIETIARKENFLVIGVGIDHDTKHLYPRSSMTSADLLGLAILEAVSDALTKA